MRKAAFIISLSILTVFLTGHFFIYKSVLKAHKKEFKAFIRSNYAKIEYLEINPSQLYTDNREMQWLDENKEVCLNGVMYDILSIKNSGEKIILSVVNDQDEQELMNRYLNEFNSIYENGNSGKKSNHLLKDLLSLKFFQKSFSKINLFTTQYAYSPAIAFNTTSTYLGVQTPPPLI